MLLRQGLSDCELILVNDGSTDDTLSLLREYERAYPDIYVIDQENQGVSVARNKGLEAARGEYVYFLDSDDTLTDGTLAYFKRTIAGHPDCQLFAFGYETRRNGVKYKTYAYPRFDYQELSGRVFLRGFLSKRICVHICSCIFRRRFLEEEPVCFQPGVRIGEDILFFLRNLPRVGKGYYSSRVSFVYLIRRDSATLGYRSYNRTLYASHTLFQTYLRPLADKDGRLRPYINFFLLYSYMANWVRYMRFGRKDEVLNRLFLQDGRIRYRGNFVGNVPYWILMRLTRLIPLRFLFWLFKS